MAIYNSKNYDSTNIESRVNYNVVNQAPIFARKKDTNGNCTIFEYTLASEINFSNETYLLTKIFTINSESPDEIKIKIIEQKGANSIDRNIIVNPQEQRIFPYDNRYLGPKTSIFHTSQAQIVSESAKMSLCFKFHINKIKTAPHIYKDPKAAEITFPSISIFSEVRDNIVHPITVSSLLKDLFSNFNKNLVRLYIVGNFGFFPLDIAKDRNGRYMNLRNSNKYTENYEKDSKIFLEERANSLASHIFGNPINSSPVYENIIISSAQSILDPNNDSSMEYANNSLSQYIITDDIISRNFSTVFLSRFSYITNEQDLIRKLDSLKLRKASFSAGAIFIWDVPSDDWNEVFNFHFPVNGTNIYDSRLSNDEKTKNQNILAGIINIMSDSNLNYLKKFQLTGFTDSDGGETFNQTLSENRALDVRNKIIAINNAWSTRLQTEGKGELFPIGDNSTSEGKALNRRVEFKVIEISSCN